MMASMLWASVSLLATVASRSLSLLLVIHHHPPATRRPTATRAMTRMLLRLLGPPPAEETAAAPWAAPAPRTVLPSRTRLILIKHPPTSVWPDQQRWTCSAQSQPTPRG